ncbi:hypothetical protein AVEN_138526-1 [Araneus ventricosus]|uniref:RNase H type-1 domain-containing protein n=1 Tax=Araneus ventricosus TaxID=182803 RepID=A0A4Y2GIJ5_ARAVE|nr:hypothetical protein AVEN_138526-1 [Araneus ventricosus]
MAKLQPETSVFQAELLAIDEAINWKIEHNVVCNIWSDSMSSLLGIKSLITLIIVQTLLSQYPYITINRVKAHNGHFGNEKFEQLAKRPTIEETAFNLQKTISFLKKILTQLYFDSWQREWKKEQIAVTLTTSYRKVALIPR